MRVLQICHKPPSPNQDGGSIAMYNTSLGLLIQNCSLDILSIVTKKHPFNKDIYINDFLKKTNFKSVFIDTDIKWYKAFLNIFSDNPYITERFKSKEFESSLQTTLKNKKFDIIHLESVFSANYIDLIREHSSAKIVLRSHNVEHKIIEQRANNVGAFKKMYLLAMAQKLKVFEKLINRKVDAICTITKNDKLEFVTKKIVHKFHVIPFGVDCKNFQVQPFKNFHLYHIGSMNWLPNKEGVEWFINKVWSKINAAHPTTQLYLAGRGMKPNFLKSHHLNVNILGAVESSKAFMSEHGIMIVPLLTGGGMRVKVVEAMAMGKAIVSTTKGAEGINYTHNHNILIANTPIEFYEAVSRLIFTPNLMETISANARKLIEEEYENSVISKKLLSVYQSL